MAAWSLAIAIADSNAALGSVITSGSFTPANDDLLVVFVRTAGTTVQPVVTGSTGLAFELATNSTTSQWVFIASAKTQAVSQTVSLDFSAGVAPTAVVAPILRVSGMQILGAAALKQTAATSGGAGSTPQTSLSSVPGFTNPVFGFVGGAANPPNVTPPVGWAEPSDTGIGTPATGAEVATLDGGHTSATVTYGGTSAAAWRLIIGELDAPIPVAQSFGGGKPKGKRRDDDREYEARVRAKYEEIEAKEEAARERVSKQEEAKRQLADLADKKRQTKTIADRKRKLEARIAAYQSEIADLRLAAAGLLEEIERARGDAELQQTIDDRRRRMLLLIAAAS